MGKLRVIKRDKVPSNTKRFDELETGETFLWGDEPFIKLHNGSFNVASLMCVGDFCSGSTVKKIQMIIEWAEE